MNKEGLRLGNLISVENLYTDTKETIGYSYRRVEELNVYSGCICVEDGYRYSVPESICSGIRLTREVLECTNLIKKGITSYELIDSLELRASGRDKYYLASHSDYSGLVAFTQVKINYLHELQNLYFVLTGEELEIDIDKLNNLNE